jgi:GAF domain-containing protein
VRTLPSWLELLLDDVPAEELERRRQADGSDDEEARRALLLHTRLRDRAQRAAGLAALSEIASQLASVRDLSELLGDIATQARQLLRTDLSYLALVEGDALRIRYFDGMLGQTAPEIRLSLTAGLAGRIVTSGRAASTTDYLADTSIEHMPQADSFASEEGLRSILGVPLHAAGRTLGVLFAGERSPRPFTDSETALLSGLAGHAAVAIENARLLVAERTAATELRLVNERLRESATAVDRAVVLHDRLTDAVVRGGGPTEVVQALADVLHAQVQLVDANGRALAGEDLGVAAADVQIAADEPRAVLPATGELGLCPGVAADERLGCLVLRSQAGIEDADLRLIERGALGIALALVQQRAVADAAMRSRGELLTALVDGGEPDVLDRRAGAARIDLSQPHVLAVVDTDTPAARRLATELAHRHDGLVVDRSGRMVLLVPASTDLAPLAALATVGVSEPLRGAAAIPTAYAEASRCLVAALALGRRNILATAEALGVYRFLLAPGGADEAAAFVHRTLGPLLDHDVTRSTELCRTLEEYLDSGRQHTATAETLHIHPNTLYQRLTRIGAVLGEDWRTPDRALDLHLALRLHRLAGAL